MLRIAPRQEQADRHFREVRRAWAFRFGLLVLLRISAPLSQAKMRCRPLRGVMVIKVGGNSPSRPKRLPKSNAQLAGSARVLFGSRFGHQIDARDL